MKAILHADMLTLRTRATGRGLRASARYLSVCRNRFFAPSDLYEDSVVPPGLELFFAVFPALKRWAIIIRPSGAG